MKTSHLLFLPLILFFSCQTEIEVKIPDYYNKLVVEGYIENGQYPIVSLSRSIPYFSTMTMNYLRDSVIITDAKVTITSSKGETQELIFMPFLQAPLFFGYTTWAMKGELNTSYTLTVEWNNKTYTSTTSILNTFDLDSVGFVPTFGKTAIDSVANLRIWMTDDGQPDNYYQFKVKIHNEDFQDRLWITTIPAAFDNSPFKGTSFNYEIMRGAPSTIFMPEMTEREMRRYMRMNYRTGDTVYLKYARLDYGGFRFWLSANGELTFGQNPFMSPTPIVSNIQSSTGERCLGVWCGAAAQEWVGVLDTATAKSSGATFRFR
ncbi:MAG: DUF4249 domain-containing protein [Lentimicrobiaceae bacterium]|nr:DUF4249 domain-containing protein [Lentimicrobiaceae bacterium]